MQQSLLENPDKGWNKYKIPKSVFKSACQKHIRRGNTESALRCAKANIELDAHDFARRIMVIAPEEVAIHPYLPNMVRIVQRLSKRGEVATDNDKDIMLTIVRDCSEAKYRDTYMRKPRTDFVLTKEQFEYLPEKRQSILKALKYRSSIGGMKWDTNMLLDGINHISEKWINGEKYEYEMFYHTLDLPMVDNREVSMPDKEDFPYYVLDFHCFPPIVKLLLNKPYYENGVKKYEPTEYSKAIEIFKPAISYPIIPVHKGDTSEDEWLKKIMWIYEGGFSTKIDVYTQKPFDLFDEERVKWTPEDRRIFDELHSILVPLWKDVADWYLFKK